MTARAKTGEVMGLLFVIASTFAASVGLLAHHSYAMFDMVRQVEVAGTVKEFQWTNPHLWIEVLVPNGSGGEDQYSVEGLNLRSMRSIGWTRTTLKPGDKIIVALHPFRNGDKGGSLMWVVLADGTKMSGGVPANVTTD